MTVKEVYEIVKDIHEKIDKLAESKTDKKDCKEKTSLIWKVMLSLFGVNVVCAIGIIITIWLAMT